MGDKNAVAQTEGTCDLVVKVGHGILKSIYTSTTGNSTWIIRDGISVCPAVGTVTVCCTVPNTFSCAAITVMCVLEELTACGTVTVCTVLEQRAATGTITMMCAVGEADAVGTITIACPTIEGVACGTIKLASVAVGRTVTVNGLLYTAVCGAKSNHTEFNIAGTDAVDALDLQDSLNNDCRCIPACDCACGITTSICGAVVTVISVLAMCSANCIELVSSDACDLAISACGFTCGKDTDGIVINGLAYCGTCATCACAGTFDIVGETNCAAATNLALAINCDCRAGTLNDLTAAAMCAVVTATQTVGGVAGNATTLVSNAGCRLLISGACFTLGVDGDFVTLNGLVYTAVVGAKAGMCSCEFSIDTSNCAAAIDLTAAVNADVRLGTLFDLSSTSCTAVSTVCVACVCAGCMGNAVAMLTNDNCNLTISGATLTGGETADTVTINGLVYTAVCGAGCTAAGEFSTDTGDTETATDLALRICCDARCGTCPCGVTACSCAAVVTVCAVKTGCDGNCILMATSDVCTICLSDCNLTGGNDACTVTVNGLTYTAVCCTKMCCSEFSTDTGNTETATDLADSICMDARAGTTGDLSAGSCAAIVTVTTDVCGVAGDAITIVSDCMCTINVGCGFEGGVDADVLTLNGLTFTASCANCNCCGCWDATCMDACNLATVIQADVRTGITVPTHGIATAVNMCCVITITADDGAVGSCICLSSNDAAALAVSGSTLTGGLGREVIEIALVGVTSGEISMPYFNHPMRDGIFVDHISGCTGRLTFIYE